MKKITLCNLFTSVVGGGANSVIFFTFGMVIARNNFRCELNIHFQYELNEEPNVHVDARPTNVKSYGVSWLMESSRPMVEWQYI